jgi:hypothetical protein
VTGASRHYLAHTFKTEFPCHIFKRLVKKM